MHDSEVRRILIVDNDEAVLLALERLLEDENYTTATAVSHQEASTILSRGQFDLLVLDDQLSDKNAIEALSDFRNSGATPLVVVTYHRDLPSDRKAQLRSLGASALVNKRAHDALVEIIDYLLDHHGKVYREFDSMT